jgi:aarF domain-containing kinase
VIIRPNPARPAQAQIVLLDHGLYVRMSDEFRRQYAVLWKGLLALDQDTIVGVTREWGFGAPDVFASATLMRPVHFKAGKAAKNGGNVERPRQLTNYELGVEMKRKARRP